ncbi:MAG: alpha-ketoglutarate-dependent dioxygenase AlkB [Elusimicrobia bacterium]|nr:alpha-ketoglutarate-dependent dioxygenase AlkB [Elusimicrobiota bacterium]
MGRSSEKRRLRPHLLNKSPPGRSSYVARYPVQLDPPPGLVYREDFLTEAEESDVAARLGRLELKTFVMRGVTSRRLVGHFGWDYLYDAWKIAPAPPIPDFLIPIRARAARELDIDPATLEEVLVTRYPPGAGIGWHRDAPMFANPVIGVSFLSPCVMRFRRQDGASYRAFNITLAPRSLYAFSGEARDTWQHAIPAAPELRYSVTFRVVKPGYKRTN